MDEQTRRFVRTMRIAALQAGAVALRLQGQVRNQKKRTSAGTPESEALTVADLAAQDVILHLLADALPEVSIDAEEDTASVRLFPPAAPGRSEVVVDPVDGTLSYLMGSGDFAVMAGLFREAWLVASVAAYPAHGALHWAIAGGGCHSQPAGADPQRARVADAAESVLVSPRVPESWREALRAAGHEVVVSRCSAVDSAAPLLGRGACVYRGRADRRRSIALLLTHEAGGVVRFGDRTWSGEDPTTLPADTDVTVAAGSEAIASALLRAVRNAPA